ncbi:hypothetical protein BC936DRAFT_140673 [Jimgerdemannia flammicorona]|uniref:NAD-dependent epimerase/dehydratase domain-containing protein n=1 Tax=Jimgerdemannia flammicorona TaxID=994334 RepID=A0A433DGQ2_9FUNG|nr:hypothetical protein BC936DRAFT_140673 [Jimgerdemannia flammicorona]
MNRVLLTIFHTPSSTSQFNLLHKNQHQHNNSIEMVKVFVLGATGYIGNPVAKAFARAGHEYVFFLLFIGFFDRWVQLYSSQIQLYENPLVTGVVGEATKPETWGAAASSASIVVDLSRDDQNEAPLATAVLEGVTRIAKQTGRKITFIYTSCSWTYGKRSPGITEEDDICDTPDELVRVAVRQDDFSQAAEGRVNLWGDGSLRLPVVHVDDLGRSDGAFVWWRQVPNLKLPTSYKYCFRPISSTSIYSTAEAYVSAAENIDRTSGEIINVANPSTESIGEASRAALLAAGHPKGQVIFSPPTNWIEEKLTWSLHLSTRKAAYLLGFRQKHPGVVDGMETYYRTWKAYQA